VEPQPFHVGKWDHLVEVWHVVELPHALPKMHLKCTAPQIFTLLFSSEDYGRII
jgi:hypothetical protein